ncbi:MAG: SgcJ/EcaC family oxidoreductase [Gemmatimonadales bacterium]|jgi:uncharacterized protein (TIGR02246 family)
MKRWTLLTFALFLVLPGIAQAQEEAEKEMPAGHEMGEMAEMDRDAMHAQMVASATAAIHAADEAFVQAFNTGDAAGVAAIYTDDAMVMAPGAPAVRGTAAIEGMMGSFFGEGPGPQLSIDTKNVELMMSPGVGHTAVATGSWTMNAPDGTHLDHGKALVVWRQTDDGWKISRDMWNSDMAPQR